MCEYPLAFIIIIFSFNEAYSPPLGESVGPGRCLKPAKREIKNCFKSIIH